jgi:hypothetical protein
MKYYVLWKKDNEMLFWYLEKYYSLLRMKLEKISNILNSHKNIEKLLKWDYKEFIMHPDNSSIINLIYARRVLWRKDDIDIKSFEDIFIEQVSLLFSWEYSKLLMNQWNQIWGTNIYLTDQLCNPYDGKDPHPDHKNTGGILWYWTKPVDNWVNLYHKTFELLRLVDEWVYDELNQIIRKIAPLGTSEWLHNSASYQEAIWDLYLGYTIDSKYPEINNLEAIIHESSHNKLNLILHFDKLILNDNSENYYSPYRPDARHIHGIYLGVHAFVPTINILMKAYIKWQIHDKWLWLEKIVLYYIKNKISINVLKKHWKFTNLWKIILDEIIEVHALTEPLLKQLDINKDHLDEITLYAKSHFQSVNINYPNLLY